MSELTYHRPATLAEAQALGVTYGGAARYLAGGTEVLVDLRQGRYPTEHVISLASIPDLNTICLSADRLHIGAMVTIAAVAESNDVNRVLPSLCHAASCIGSVQIRNRATIGGNFCGAVPCADTPPICIAAGAELRLADSSGERMVAARDFFRGPRESVLQPGELLVAIIIPVQPESSGASYQRFSLRHGSALAVASVAARVVLVGTKVADAAVVLGAVAPIPLPASECAASLLGQEPSDELFVRAAETAAEEAKPISDIRGSEQFRRELVRVLTVRALREAVDRAGRALP